MNLSNLKFEDLPSAIERIQGDISEIKRIISREEPEYKNHLLVIDEASDLLKLSKSTIYRLVCERKIPYHKMGKRLYFVENELISWVKNGRESDAKGEKA